MRPPDLERNEYETVLIYDEHYLGSDGLPAWQETRQTIRSLVDDVDHFPFRFDTDEVDVELLRGGNEEPMARYNQNYWEVPFRFPKPLDYGEFHGFTYRLKFRYKESPSREYRRVIFGHLDGFHVHVYLIVPENQPRSGGLSGNVPKSAARSRTKNRLSLTTTLQCIVTSCTSTERLSDSAGSGDTRNCCAPPP